MRSIALDHVPHIHYLLRHRLVRQPALPNVPAVIPILCANGVSAESDDRDLSSDG